MSLLSLKDKINFPTDWKIEPIGKILLSSQYGTSKSSSETGVPVIGMKNLQDGKVDFKDLSFVSLDDDEKEKLLLKDGDILLNRTNSCDLVGKVGFVKKAIEAVFASYLVRLEVDKTKADPKFVAMWLSGFWANQMIKKIATRAISQANVNPTEFKKFCLVPVMPLKEQKSIADLLSTWDEAIEKTERLIQAKEKQHRWLLHHLIDNKSARQHWETLDLGSVIRERSERSKVHDEYPVLTSSRRGLFLQSEYFSKKVTSKDNTGYKIMRRGDFTFRSMSDDGRFVFNRLQEHETGIISPAYGVFYAYGAHPEFLAHFLNSRYFSHILARETQGGTRKALRFSTLVSMEVDFPKHTDQERIANILDKSQREIKLLQTLLDLLRRQKRGLMQRLLTGKWRVKTEKEIV